jgi:hypothetical protein
LVRIDPSVNVGPPMFSFHYIPSEHTELEPQVEAALDFDAGSVEAAQAKHVDGVDKSSPKKTGNKEAQTADITDTSVTTNNPKATSDYARVSEACAALSTDEVSKSDHFQAVDGLLANDSQMDSAVESSNIVE